MVGLIVGGMMVYLFAALAIEAVGRAGGGVIEEVRRRQSQIMDRTEKPDYARARSRSTGSTISFSTMGSSLLQLVGCE